MLKAFRRWAGSTISRLTKSFFTAFTIAIIVAMFAFFFLTRWRFLWSPTGTTVLSAVTWVITAAAAFGALLGWLVNLRAQRRGLPSPSSNRWIVVNVILTIVTRILQPTPTISPDDFSQLKFVITNTDQRSPDVSPDVVRIAKGVELSETDPLKLAQGKLALKNFPAAIALFDKAMEDPQKTLADAHFYKARALWAMGKYDDALDEANRSLSFRPMFSPALVIKGASLRHLRRFDEALSASSDAVNADPHNESAWSTKGGVLIELGDFEGKKGRHRYEEALSAFEIGIKVRSDFPQLWNNKSIALHRLGRDQEALAAVNEALRLAPEYNDALLNKGTYLKRLNRLGEAVELYRQLTVRNPSDAEAWNNLGDAKEHNGDLPGALIDYDTAVTLKPDFPDALFNKGGGLAELGRYDESIAPLQRACELRPSDYEAEYMLAYSLNKLGRKKEALSALAVALKVEPGYKDATSLRRGIIGHSK
jgi:tetratricopeptide (TPR) repeat protein/uncharacterized membrane protein YidH (DUF202 family)